MTWICEMCGQRYDRQPPRSHCQRCNHPQLASLNRVATEEVQRHLAPFLEGNTLTDTRWVCAGCGQQRDPNSRDYCECGRYGVIQAPSAEEAVPAAAPQETWRDRPPLL